MRQRSVLPPTLSAQLSALSTQRFRTLSDSELQDILAEFSTLPAKLIVDASREMMDIVSPYEPSLLEQLKRSEQSLMNKDQDYAWFFLFHRSGYIREAALWHVSAPPKSPFFFAALALRLNDWVAQVRQAAKRCFKRISDEVATNVAADAALYLIERRFVWGRWRDEVSILDLVFARDDVLAALAKRLETRPTGSLATCLRHALRYSGIDRHLPQLAATAVQPAVRAVAYQCLISGKATWPAGFEWAWVDKVYGLRRRIPKLETRTVERVRPTGDYVEEGIRDKSPFVRRIVADGLIAMRSQIPDEEALVAHLAMDRSPAVRSRADFLLRHPASQQ
jgi:hypothetical protein